jgi:hypothetical protein
MGKESFAEAVCHTTLWEQCGNRSGWFSGVALSIRYTIVVVSTNFNRDQVKKWRGDFTVEMLHVLIPGQTVKFIAYHIGSHSYECQVSKCLFISLLAQAAFSNKCSLAYVLGSPFHSAQLLSKPARRVGYKTSPGAFSFRQTQDHTAGGKCNATSLLLM